MRLAYIEQVKITNENWSDIKVRDINGLTSISKDDLVSKVNNKEIVLINASVDESGKLHFMTSQNIVKVIKEIVEPVLRCSYYTLWFNWNYGVDFCNSESVAEYLNRFFSVSKVYKYLNTIYNDEKSNRKHSYDTNEFIKQHERLMYYFNYLCERDDLLVCMMFMMNNPNGNYASKVFWEGMNDIARYQNKKIYLTISENTVGYTFMIAHDTYRNTQNCLCNLYDLEAEDDCYLEYELEISNGQVSKVTKLF